MTRYFWVIAAFLYAFAATVRAEQFVRMGSNHAAAVFIDRSSIAPVDGVRNAVGVWVYGTYVTSVDCSPPRGCYASSERAYLRVLCRGRAVAVVQRISMDLNGSVVAVSDANESPPYFRPAGGTMEGGALKLLCGGDPRLQDD